MKWVIPGFRVTTAKQEEQNWMYGRSLKQVILCIIMAAGHSLDPRLQSEDLGDNAMKASTYGIANLKRILPNIEIWTYQKGQDFSDLKELYNEVPSMADIWAM
ncbi:hypothetical protein CS542_00125 [Pedobacter sp. IW39]|nr:hypothetical protein CS542_00125 [Pedobacter sp. IW39]